MAPRINPLRDDKKINEFLAAFYNTDQAFDEVSKADLHIPPSSEVLKATRKQFRDADDYMLSDAVLRAQAHQLAALFIRRARRAANLSTQQLATKMGVGLTILSEAQSFSSVRKVPLDLLLRVAVACGGDLSLALDSSKVDVGARRTTLERTKRNIEARQRK